MDFFANLLSALGAIFLFAGYYQVSMKKQEKTGLKLSGIGSFIMIFAFYLFDSYAFIALNIIWLGISIYGIFNRNESTNKPIPHENVTKGGHGILISLVFLSAILLLTGEYEALSWTIISIMVLSYLLFSAKAFTSTQYVLYSMIANVISFPYLYSIGNMSSIIQTGISIYISGLSLYKDSKEQKKEE